MNEGLMRTSLYNKSWAQLDVGAKRWIQRPGCPVRTVQVLPLLRWHQTDNAPLRVYTTAALFTQDNLE